MTNKQTTPEVDDFMLNDVEQAVDPRAPGKKDFPGTPRPGDPFDPSRGMPNEPEPTDPTRREYPDDPAGDPSEPERSADRTDR